MSRIVSRVLSTFRTNEVKLFGLQRSGTNLLKELLESHYDVRVHSNIGGWKHGHHVVPLVLGRYVDCIFVTKNPYSWLTSMHRYLLRRGHELQECSKDFHDFVTSPLVLHGWQHTKGGTFDTTYWAPTPVHHWNTMNHHWLSLETDIPRNSQRQSIHVRYEDILTDLMPTMTDLGTRLNLRRTDHSLAGVTQEVLPSSGERTEVSTATFARTSYYIGEEYLAHYTQPLLELVNKDLNSSLMSRLDYAVVHTTKPQHLEHVN